MRAGDAAGQTPQSHHQPTDAHEPAAVEFAHDSFAGENAATSQEGASNQGFDFYVRTANASFAMVAPTRQVSRLSVGGGLVLSDSDISSHPLSELDSAALESLDAGSSGAVTPPPAPGGGAQEPKEAPPKPPYGWPDCKDYPHWYWRRLIGFDQSRDVFGFFLSWDQIFAFVFTCITLVLFAIIEHYGFHPLLNHSLHFFIPAFGASCTVIFGVPKAPIAQPRNVVVAHVTAAIIGTALTNAFRSVTTHAPFGSHMAGAIGVALHLALMQVTNTMHPPASATVVSAAIAEINAYYEDEGFLFVITPVLVGSLLCCVMAWLLNNLVPSRGPYPQYW